MTQNITTYSIYSRANGELKYSLLGVRRLKPIRAQKVQNNVIVLSQKMGLKIVNSINLLFIKH